MNEQIGRVILLAGLVLVVVGLIVTFVDRIPLLGKLPGDVHLRRGNFHVYFPVATSIVLSVLLTLLFWIVSRFARK
jgi:hypothetical protein